MEAHHSRSIDNLTASLRKDDTIFALILGGSLAHGFAQGDSDIDVTMVVSTEEYRRRTRENILHYNNRELCTCENGCIDGKYADQGFLESVAERGSDPARYAFHNNRILFTRLPGLEDLLGRIVLTINEMLYPCHKWLLRVLGTAPRRPKGLMTMIEALLDRPSRDFVHDCRQAVFTFAGIDLEKTYDVWPTRFMKDTETRWMIGEPAIDDL